MVKKTSFKFPTERYLKIVKTGYKDCDLDKKYKKYWKGWGDWLGTFNKKGAVKGNKNAIGG